ncbi:3-oxoacid CoA-transferase subunit B [Clostridium saccharoperbutylacetonicum]|uniref:3-oxoacid CoA-transferase subunit B n=1 Tax=Clostridium saccharoperbutylacetonicum TaxID=36745 RepID=UPI0039E96F44
MEKREIIARRVVKEFKEGDVVNLGIGIPTLVANYIPSNMNVHLQSENGILGLGPVPSEDEKDNNVLDAGGKYISTVKGASFFDSAYSFSLIRGGHIDITVLGALEVDEEGNLANWMVPGKRVSGMGGAMDLVVGAKRVIVAMEHLNKNGECKIIKRCNLPLTAAKQVNTIITDMGVMDIDREKGIVLKEIAPRVTLEEIQKATKSNLIISKDLKVMEL